MDTRQVELLLPPPAQPVDAPPLAEWGNIEARLLVKLPDDYKAFVSRYGLGCIDGFLWVLSPTTQNNFLNLAKRIESTGRELTLLREMDVPVPYEWYPAEKGLVLWGVTENGDRLYWMSSDRGVVVVVEDSEPDGWQEFVMPPIEFLLQCLSRQIKVDAFPPDFPAERSTFYRLGDDYLHSKRQRR